MPTSAYKSSDGYFNIGASGGGMWIRFCNAANRPDLLEREEFKTEPLRAKNRKALNEEINRITVTKTSAQWVADLNAAGVPAGPIYTLDQVFADPQVQHIGAAATVHHPVLGDIQVVNQAVGLSRTPASMARATPEQGESTAEVLTDLGFSAEQIEALRTQRIV